MERFVFDSYPMGWTRENIPWLVLEKKENRAKLISEYVQDWSPFNQSRNAFLPPTWDSKKTPQEDKKGFGTRKRDKSLFCVV